MITTEILKKIVSELRENGDEERIQFSKTMAPTSMEMLGVTTPVYRKILKKWLSELMDLPTEDWIGLTKSLVQTNIFECNQFAYELLWKNKDALSLIRLNHVVELGRSIDNWASVDTLALMVTGWAWRENQIGDEDVLSWLNSENRWWRRLAIVSTIPLNMKSRGGKGDVRRTLMICEKVVNDRDDMIVKALSWALRELSKSNRPAVIGFMFRYNDRLANHIRKEVTNKLETGKKSG